MLQHRVGATQPGPISLPLSAFEMADFTAVVPRVCASPRARVRRAGNGLELNLFEHQTIATSF